MCGERVIWFANGTQIARWVHLQEMFFFCAIVPPEAHSGPTGFWGKSRPEATRRCTWRRPKATSRLQSCCWAKAPRWTPRTTMARGLNPGSRARHPVFLRGTSKNSGISDHKITCQPVNQCIIWRRDDFFFTCKVATLRIWIEGPWPVLDAKSLTGLAWAPSFDQLLLHKAFIRGAGVFFLVCFFVFFFVFPASVGFWLLLAFCLLVAFGFYWLFGFCWLLASVGFGRDEGRKEGRKEAGKEGRKEGGKQGMKEGMKEGRKPGSQEEGWFLRICIAFSFQQSDNSMPWCQSLSSF